MEEARALLAVKHLPHAYEVKAKFFLCKYLTEEKQYGEAHDFCTFVETHKGDLGEEQDASEATCALATALMAEEKYDEAIRLLNDALKDNQNNKRVGVRRGSER